MSLATIGLPGLQGRVDSYLNKTYPSELYLLPMLVSTFSIAIIAANILKTLEPQVEKLNIHKENRKSAEVACQTLSGASLFALFSFSGTVRKVSAYSSVALFIAALSIHQEEEKSNPWIKIAIFTIPLALAEAWMRKYP